MATGIHSSKWYINIHYVCLFMGNNTWYKRELGWKRKQDEVKVFPPAKGASSSLFDEKLDG